MRQSIPKDLLVFTRLSKRAAQNCALGLEALSTKGYDDSGCELITGGDQRLGGHFQAIITRLRTTHRLAYEILGRKGWNRGKKRYGQRRGHSDRYSQELSGEPVVHLDLPSGLRAKAGKNQEAATVRSF
jgi:hypothetical protein